MSQNPGVASGGTAPPVVGAGGSQGFPNPFSVLTRLVRRATERLSRAIKLGVLLLSIALILIATAFLDRSSQVAVLKVFAILFLSLFPGWLYLQFVELKGKGLYDEYVLNLYRLMIDDISNLPKPPPGSPYWDSWKEAQKPGVDCASNIYLKKFEAVYGRSAVPDSRRDAELEGDTPPPTEGTSPASRGPTIVERFKVDAFFPVVLLTMLLSAGWSALLVPELLSGWQIYSGPFSGLPDFPVELIQYAFIGSYAFLLQQMIRRYFQYDLKSSAYVSGIVRFIVAASVVVALHPVAESLGLDSNAQITLAFLIGFYPEYGFKLAWQFITTKLGGQNPTEERFPLSDIDGLDIWSRARLLEEGVEDMQNLACVNLVDVMLSTRTPINRLVDWVDQAFLYLRVTAGGGSDDRAKLRRIGVRTATDLFDAFEPKSVEDRSFKTRLLRVLNDNDDQPSATEGLRRTLETEVNLWHIRQWKKREWLEQAAK